MPDLSSRLNLNVRQESLAHASAKVRVVKAPWDFMMASMDDFIYPVRLYTRAYRDVTDYVIEGDANSTTPPAQNLKHADDTSTVLVRATFMHAEERDAALERARSLVSENQQVLYWLLAPEDRFFQLHRGMPEVYVPDAQGQGMRAEGEREILVRVAPWPEEA